MRKIVFAFIIGLLISTSFYAQSGEDAEGVVDLNALSEILAEGNPPALQLGQDNTLIENTSVTSQDRLRASRHLRRIERIRYLAELLRQKWHDGNYAMNGFDTYAANLEEQQGKYRRNYEYLRANNLLSQQDALRYQMPPEVEARLPSTKKALHQEAHSYFQPESVAPFSTQIRVNNSGTSRSFDPGNLNRHCSAGGFVEKVVPPPSDEFLLEPNKPRPGYYLQNIRDPKYDRDCRTPSEITFSFDGKPITVTCAPTPDHPNRRLYQQFFMCDPFFYGALPSKNSPGHGLANCKPPGLYNLSFLHRKEERVGPDGTVTPGETRSGVLREVFAQRRDLSADSTMGAGNDPEMVNKSCQFLADYQLSPALKGQFPDSEVPAADLMAAKIALENPVQWENRQRRVRGHCESDQPRKHYGSKEKTSCLSLLDRLSRVLAAIDELQRLQGATDTPYDDQGVEE